MCLILFHYDPEGEYPLTVMANRDEFHERKTLQAAFWDDAPNILAGRDMEKGGTWMGVSRTGRFAAVTNYRSLADMRPGGASRGDLTRLFLAGECESTDEGPLRAPVPRLPVSTSSTGPRASLAPLFHAAGR